MTNSTDIIALALGVKRIRKSDRTEKKISDHDTRVRKITIVNLPESGLLHIRLETT